MTESNTPKNATELLNGKGSPIGGFKTSPITSNLTNLATTAISPFINETQNLNETIKGLTATFAANDKSTNAWVRNLSKVGATVSTLGGGIILLSDKLRNHQRELAQATLGSGEFSMAQEKASDVLNNFSAKMGEAAKITGQSFQEISNNVSGLLKTSIDVASGVGSVGDALSKTTDAFDSYSRMVVISRNTGVSLNDSMTLTTQLFKDQGMTIDQVSGTLVGMQTAVRDTGATTEQGLKTLSQMSQAYRFLEFDSTKAAMAIGSVATYAAQYPQTFKSPQQALEVYGKAVGGVADAQQNFAKSMFFGEVGGLGRGVKGMLEFMEQDPTDAMKTVLSSIKQVTGGQIVTTQDAKTGGAREEGTFLAQVKLIEQMTGLGTREAMKYLDLAGATEKGDMLAPDKAAEILKRKEAVESGDVRGLGEQEYGRQLLTSSERTSQVLGEVRMGLMELSDKGVTPVLDGFQRLAETTKDFGKTLITGMGTQLGLNNSEEQRKNIERTISNAKDRWNNKEISPASTETINKQLLTSSEKQNQILGETRASAEKNASNQMKSAEQIGAKIKESAKESKNTPDKPLTEKTSSSPSQTLLKTEISPLGAGQQEQWKRNNWKSVIGNFAAAGGAPTYTPTMGGLIGEEGFGNIRQGSTGGPSKGRELFEKNKTIGLHRRGVIETTSETTPVDMISMSQEQQVANLKRYSDAIGDLDSTKLTEQAKTPVQKKALSSISKYTEIFNQQMEKGVGTVKASQLALSKAQQSAGGNLEEVLESALDGSDKQLSQALTNMSGIINWEQYNPSKQTRPQITTTQKRIGGSIDFGGVSSIKPEKQSYYQGLMDEGLGIPKMTQVSYKIPSINDYAKSAQNQLQDKKSANLEEKAPQIIESHITITLDGEVVGKKVTQSKAFHSAVNKTVQTETGKDYINHGNKGRS